MITKTIKIDDISVGNRFRKDLGDIDGLANKIKDIGLLSPIGITPDNKLIYGARRIEAYKRLGWTEIPAYVIPLEDIIKGEFIENTARKDFTFSERMAILEEIESRRIGHKVSKERVADLQPFQQENKGKKSVNIVANYTGTSPRQLSKEKAIVQKVKQKPQLGHIVEKLDSGEMSVNEADEWIKRREEFDAEEAKNAKWRRLREEVLEQDSRKCTKCGYDSHLDVYPIHPYGDKKEAEDLETLCKDCHELKMNFYEEFGLPRLLTSIFQHLTDISGKRWFQYSIYGSKIIRDRINNNKEGDSVTTAAAAADDDLVNYDSYTKKMEASPYSKLKGASDAELVSNTRKHRELLIETMDKSWYGDRVIYGTQEVLHDLLPILKDYSEMIDKEADARQKKDELSKR